MTRTSVQEEGGSARLYLGIDGTMGDAQDVAHDYVGSVHGSWCRVCGLSLKARIHWRTLEMCGFTAAVGKSTEGYCTLPKGHSRTSRQYAHFDGTSHHEFDGNGWRRTDPEAAP